MARRPAVHRTQPPPIPAVSPETRRQLLAAAAAFGGLAPWTWMRDAELVGLRHPTTGEPLLCSVLGRLKQVFALLVYRRDTGRRWILNTILRDGDAGGLEDGESAFEQDCVKVEFVTRRDLDETDRATLAAAGFAPAEKRGRVWPAFRSLVPGGHPWHVTQAEAELLRHALPRVAAVAALCRHAPELEIDLGGRGVPFVPADFDPAQRALHPEDLDWQPQIPPPEPQPPLAMLEDEELEQLAALPRAAGFRLELDLFYSALAVVGKERPYFPKAVMAVDRATGLIVAFRLAEAGDLEGAVALGNAFAATLRQLGHRPQSIEVQRSRVAQMLTAVAGRLGIPVRQVEELPTLNAARDHVTHMLASAG